MVYEWQELLCLSSNHIPDTAKSLKFMITWMLLALIYQDHFSDEDLNSER